MAVEIPTRDEHRAAWASLTMADRRRVMRAVTRGVAVEDRKDAKLALGAAEQQKGFWKWAWGLGPMLGLVVAFSDEWIVAVVNGLVSTLLIVALSRWRWLRADRSQRANLALLERTGSPRKKPRPTSKGHLPSDPGMPRADSASSSRSHRPTPSRPNWSGDAPDPNTSKAKLQRRKKRK
ncbi:MAG: hypothetical protein R3249_07570 [Nitriliruptorales bacterium]|nr:hypothetical protein [Nitriliruptorales bacterium]